MDHRKELLKEEHRRLLMNGTAKVVLFFVSAILFKWAWYFSFVPVFDFRAISYVEALGFVLIIRLLIGFPEYNRGMQRRLEMQLHLKNQAFMRRILMEQLEMLKEHYQRNNPSNKKEELKKKNTEVH